MARDATAAARDVLAAAVATADAVEDRPRVRPEDYTPEIKTKLRELATVSARLAQANADATRRAEVVEELVALGVSVTAQARYVGISAAALYKSRRRAKATAG